MPSLKDLIGKEINVSIPTTEPSGYLRVKLLAVEDAGLWIESDYINQKIFVPAIVSVREEQQAKNFLSVLVD